MAMFVVSLALVLLFNQNYITCIDVNTTSGVVRGQTITVYNPSGSQSIDQFLGIPFAEPPVEILRFAKPVPIKISKDIIDATKPKGSCWQIQQLYGGILTFSEDCLFLNVWTQNATKLSSDQLKPVMFWIHGGSLTSGSIFMDVYNGSVLATNDVVIVTTNYRLGQFGYFYGDRDDAPGNVGFFDQLLALKWVRDNIHLFGGDKDQITIFGESAGSMSVSAHILSPQSKGMFKRAIMQSGAHMYNKDRDEVSKTKALAAGKKFASKVGCGLSLDWINCMKKVDPLKLLLHQGQTFSVLGTEFLPISSQQAFQDKQFNTDIDLMAGVVHDEGANFIKGVTIHPDKLTLLDFEIAVKLLNDAFHGIDVKAVSDFYLKDVDILNKTAMRLALTDVLSDLALKCPTYLFTKQFAKIMNQTQNVYYYQVDYASVTYGPHLLGCDVKTMGVCHAQEVPFVFGLPYINQQLFEPKDMYFSREIMNWWTKFAKNGHQGNEWPLMVSKPDLIIKGLHPDNLTLLLDNPYHKTCDGFWSNYFLG